jgi:hypothetical protein
MVRGLLAELPRKDCWTLAEQAGDATPALMHRFLSRGVWDHDGVRGDVARFVVDRLSDSRSGTSSARVRPLPSSRNGPLKSTGQ